MDEPQSNQEQALREDRSQDLGIIDQCCSEKDCKTDIAVGRSEGYHQSLIRGSYAQGEPGHERDLIEKHVGPGFRETERGQMAGFE